MVLTRVEWWGGGWDILVLLYFSAGQTSKLFQKCSDFQKMAVDVDVWLLLYKAVNVGL